MASAFLVVLQDRHVDDSYAAFTSRADAIKCAEVWMEEWCDGEYEDKWEADISDDEEEEVEVGSFIYSWRTHEDGPSIYIEIIDLDNPEA